MRKNNETMPVFLINGFLEAGKTQFISFTLQQEYFKADETTVLILCEEGDTEYDPEILKRTKTKVVTVDSLSELTEEFFASIEAAHDPCRVLIEWNGMWPQDQLKLPASWELFQQITIIDGDTFDLYLNNMKPLLGLMVRNSELVIMNRCDEVSDEDIVRYRRGLKALNPQAELIFEDADGEIEMDLLEEDLPYDLKADVVEIKPEHFGIWYIDALDNEERYKGKVFEFTAMALKAPEFPKNYFVTGRMAMTCCEADMTFLGFICKAREARHLETGNWVKVRAKLTYEFWQDYDGIGPVLYAESVEPAEEIKEIVQF
ncbi:MAG: GTPase [Lachnospiraceae bacterium]|nr:GTPase [Lachnospiraceae bacterium]